MGGKIVSYGTSSYGYDVRCADEFKIFTNINSTIVGSEGVRLGELRRFHRRRSASSRRTPSRSRARSSTSAFRATRWSSVWEKSTYARCGIIVNVTPLEPEWEGHVTLEFSNTTPLPAQDLRERGRGADAVLESDEVC